MNATQSAHAALNVSLGSLANWVSTRKSYDWRKNLPDFIRGITHWNASHRDRSLSSVRSCVIDYDKSMSKDAPKILPYLIDLLNIALQFPQCQLPRMDELNENSDPVIDLIAIFDILIAVSTAKEAKDDGGQCIKLLMNSISIIKQYLFHHDHVIVCLTIELFGFLPYDNNDTLINDLISFIQPNIPISIDYGNDANDTNTANATTMLTTRLFIPSLYAMTAIFRLFQHSTITETVLNACHNNLKNGENCHPRIAFQSAYLILVHDKELTAEPTWRRVLSATLDESIAHDNWMNSTRESNEWNERCHELLKHFAVDSIITHFIDLFSTVNNDPAQAWPLMRRLIELAFQEYKLQDYTIDSLESWTYSNGKRVYNKYLKPIGEQIVDELIEDNDESEGVVNHNGHHSRLHSTQLTNLQHRTLFAILINSSSWQINTNLFSFFRLPRELHDWIKLFNGTEWENQAKTIAPDLLNQLRSDKPLNKDKDSNSTNEDTNEYRCDIHGNDCGEQKEFLPSDQIPTKHSDQIRSLSIFSRVNENLSIIKTTSSSSHLMAAASKRLDLIEWSDLGHAYGNADDVPSLLRLLTHPLASKRLQVIDSLYSNVTHQNSCYTVTPYVGPYLMDLLTIVVKHPTMQAGQKHQRIHYEFDDNQPTSASNPLHSVALVDISWIIDYLNCLITGYWGYWLHNHGYQSAMRMAVASQLETLVSLLHHEDKNIVCGVKWSVIEKQARKMVKHVEINEAFLYSHYHPALTKYNWLNVLDEPCSLSYYKTLFIYILF
jgi:hypothetical protein